jgi:hypothetical protein
VVEVDPITAADPIVHVGRGRRDPVEDVVEEQDAQRLGDHRTRRVVFGTRFQQGGVDVQPVEQPAGAVGTELGRHQAAEQAHWCTITSDGSLTCGSLTPPRLRQAAGRSG